MSIKKKLFTLLVCAGAIGILSGCAPDESDPNPTILSPDKAPLIDTDKDGTPNVSDTDIDSDNIPNTQDDDIDGDGIINTKDDDIDGDGIKNIDDNDIDGDGIINTEDEDIDGDGIPNNIDPDIDGDGIANVDDNDIDGDGIPNTIDPDIDNDGIPNNQDTTPGGTGTVINGTQGTINSGTDQNHGNTIADDDDYVPGIGVVAVDSTDFDFTIPSLKKGQKITEIENIDLNDIRDEIKKNNIALSTVAITSLQVKADLATNAVIAANLTKQIVVKFYYKTAAGEIVIVETAPKAGLAGPVVTLEMLAQGLNLNKEIFGARPGFANFVDMVKDTSVPSVELFGEITLLDDLSGTANTLSLKVIITTGGKAAF